MTWGGVEVEVELEVGCEPFREEPHQGAQRKRRTRTAAHRRVNQAGHSLANHPGRGTGGGTGGGGGGTITGSPAELVIQFMSGLGPIVRALLQAPPHDGFEGRRYV